MRLASKPTSIDGISSGKQNELTAGLEGKRGAVRYGVRHRYEHTTTSIFSGRRARAQFHTRVGARECGAARSQPANHGAGG